MHASSRVIARVIALVTVLGANPLPAFPAGTPFSAYASPEAHEQALRFAGEARAAATLAGIAEVREFYDAINRDRVERFHKRYPVMTREAHLGGVLVDVVEPVRAAGAPRDPRVLINMHGGGFVQGARLGALIESIPVANLSGIPVVSVDYRLGPEHTHPAALEDIEAVYRALLKDYPPSRIGIYGCSAGGFLTAQTVARLIAKELPLPGAVGILCAGLVPPDGDSIYASALLDGRPPPAGPPQLTQNPYFREAVAEDPLIFPALAPAMLGRFPPTLFITSTRDFLMSNTVQSHRLLDAAGVRADLHVFDGLPHGFFADPEPPEAQQAQAIIARFFERELAHD